MQREKSSTLWRQYRQNMRCLPASWTAFFSSVLAEVRSEAKIELINSTNAMMAEKDEELEKAKKAAKRTLRTEPEEQPEEEHPENPEE